ncbi:MAG: DNA polymerase III subunit beta [Rikenellaceae bacterium]|jgi:DNA polymerase-3 subunit beta|nr:DNA polymerase III subunit beta [Rikenellaceae bacterium]
MKFTVSSSALLGLLSTTGKIISNKNTLPILDYFLMEVADGQLKVTGSDLETTFVGAIKVDGVEIEGAIAAPAKLMLDSLREFSEQPITIETNDTTWEIKTTWKTGQATLPGTSAQSYPAVQQLGEGANSITLDADVLVNGINKTIFATADDELRPVMNGVYFNIEPEQITFVATDAHKLVRYAAEHSSGITASFILPKKPANLLKATLAKETGAITAEFDSKNVVFHVGSYTMVCRLIEGNYPNYNAVIPTANPNKVIVDRVELLNGIKRVAVYSNQATNLIKLEIKTNHIDLLAQDLDFSVSARESVAAAYEGDNITIGFKSTFLVEILSNIETPSVVMELADSTRAGVFKPVYDDKQSTDALMLLMPMMINA